MVLKGSSALYAKMFEAFDDVKPEKGWNVIDRHDHTPEQIQWLIDHGCEWEKVCAEPGDLLLWDSVSQSGLEAGSELICVAYCSLRCHPFGSE